MAFFFFLSGTIWSSSILTKVCSLYLGAGGSGLESPSFTHLFTVDFVPAIRQVSEIQRQTAPVIVLAAKEQVCKQRMVCKL